MSLSFCSTISGVHWKAQKVQIEVVCGRTFPGANAPRLPRSDVDLAEWECSFKTDVIPRAKSSIKGPISPKFQHVDWPNCLKSESKNCSSRNRRRSRPQSRSVVPHSAALAGSSCWKVPLSADQRRDDYVWTRLPTAQTASPAGKIRCQINRAGCDRLVAPGGCGLSVSAPVASC
ncbi:unnamed protein product [Nesidiocoris tenuis]|uniref:Uncharacterized protein n=1 Tax=Nesidiocoris tenuis TaxID=355587 RepID=A0A6H5H2X1_9HEMI|nr:unnamed protein product [Nesidiocoris tenuis]